MFDRAEQIYLIDQKLCLIVLITFFMYISVDNIFKVDILFQTQTQNKMRSIQ